MTTIAIDLATRVCSVSVYSDDSAKGGVVSLDLEFDRWVGARSKVAWSY
jgi:hypothetical protein